MLSVSRKGGTGGEGVAYRILFCDTDLIYAEVDINGIGCSVWYGKDDLGS